MELIRLIIVDDHAIVRQGLSAMLTPRHGIEVVGEAKNGREAIQMVQELAPDVIIMDLNMPEIDGIEATIAIRTQNPDARILVLTSFDDQDRIVAIMAAGASGYILKDSGIHELIQAVRSVHSGHYVLTPQVMEVISSEAHQQKVEESPNISLTPRELEVLQGIVDGLTNQAIAVELGISKTTIYAHVSSILSKLNVSNRTQAALFAQEHHLLS